MMTTSVVQAAQAAQAHPGWHDGGDAPAFWPVFPITFGLFWLAVIGLGFYLVRRRTNGPGGAATAGAASATDPMSSALTILAERFARGEIDEDEYHMRMSGLRHGG